MKRTFFAVLISVLILSIVFNISVVSNNADLPIINFDDSDGTVGDVNADTCVNSGDLVELRQIILSLKSPKSFSNTDVNGDKVINVMDIVSLKKLIVDTVERYYSDGITTLSGSSDDKKTWVYRVNSSNLIVREADIDLGGTRTMTIAQISDLHLLHLNDADRNDIDILNSYNSLKNDFPDSLTASANSINFAKMFDKVVVTGDITDCLSQGSIEYVNNLLSGSNATVLIGNHDYRKVLYGSWTEKEDVDTRYAFCQLYWLNNLFYTSELLNEKVMIIGMNMGATDTYENYYPNSFTAKLSDGTEMTGKMDDFLKADLDIAREKGYAVLIFQHCPLATRNEKYYNIPSLLGDKKGDFYYWYVGSKKITQTQVDKDVYNLIKNNAALIKAIFNGHTHSHYYSEIDAKQTPESLTVDSFIPQYTLGSSGMDNGCAMRINIKY